jgi:hypothetical protein
MINSSVAYLARTAVTATLACVLSAPLRAAAVVDVTGRWDVAGVVDVNGDLMPFGATWDLVQNGTSLDIYDTNTLMALIYSGTIDPDSGAFSVIPPPVPGCGGDMLSGTASNTSFVMSGVVFLGVFCTEVTVYAGGTPLDCGNETVDAGEDCDDGAGPDAIAACCTTNCAFITNGASCSGGACFAGACVPYTPTPTPTVPTPTPTPTLQQPLDPFKCYRSKDLRDPAFAGASVSLEDQFAVNDGQFDLLKPFLLCNPTTLDGIAALNPVDHLACYKMTGPDLANADRPKVLAVDSFGTHQLEIRRPYLFCAPSLKTLLP